MPKMVPLNADASLYRTSEQYKAVGTSQASAGGAAVVPQACVNIGPCRVCVDFRIFPPRACLRFSCFGFNRSLCVP